MGFFSRGSSSQTVDETPTRSRWFSSKSKPLPPPPPPPSPFKTTYRPPPDVLPQPTLAPKVLPVSSSTLRLEQYASSQTKRSASSFAAAASVGPPRSHSSTASPGSRVASSQGGSGSHSESRESAGRPLAKGKDDATTQNLAVRLQELSIAHADGLLGDEEYRILRATIFEQQLSGVTENRASRIPGRSNNAGDQESMRSVTNRPDLGRTPSVHSTNSSMVKSTSKGSFFRRRSFVPETAQPFDNPRRQASDQSSVLSGNSFPGRDSISGRSSLAVPMGFSNLSDTLGSTFSPSVRSTRTSRSAITNQTFTAVESRPSSLFSTGSAHASIAAPPSAFHLRTPQRNGDSSGSESSSKEVRAELALVEAEGRRLLATFDSLEASALHDAEGGLGRVGAGDDWIPITSSMIEQPRRPSRGVPPPIIGRSKHAHTPSTVSSQYSGRGAGSSIRSSTDRSSPGLTTLNRSVSSSKFRPSLYENAGATSAAAASQAQIASADDPERAALEANLADIHRRRRDTEERYERRIDFLRGKLRAAEIRDKAMR